MSSLSPKDRVSLCSFTFADGRRCRTPRISNHPHLCYYHAEKEARACAADKLGKDLDYFFSGDYLSACDLSTALGRLIPAVVRGDVKPRAARTIAYLAQTLMQAIHVSQHEYCDAFSDDAWRRSVRNSVKYNQDYRFPPDPAPAHPQSSPPQPQQPAEPPVCHSEESEESASSSNSSLATHHSSTPSEAEGPLPPAPQPAPSLHAPLPPTSAEFAQHVLAGLQTGERQATPAPAQTRSPIPTLAPPTPTPTPTPAPAPSPTTAHSPQTPAAHTAPSSSVGHPEHSEGSHPLRATQSIRSAVPAPQPAPVAQPFRSLALPPHVRRRLHRDPA